LLVYKVAVIFSSIIFYNFYFFFFFCLEKYRFDRNLWYRKIIGFIVPSNARESIAIKENGTFYGYFSRFQECDPIYDNDPQHRTHVVLVPSFEEWRQLQRIDAFASGYPIMDTDESKPILTTSRHESKNRYYIKIRLWSWPLVVKVKCKN